MENGKYFQQFLAGFTHEFANGDIIRKYADKGYSVSEIREHLDFKSSKEQIYKIMWDHFQKTSQILYDKPEKASENSYEYVKDISPFGKVSFRKVKVTIDSADSLQYQEKQCTISIIEDFLAKPALYIYVTIPFGVIRFKDQALYEKILDCLEERDAIFIKEMFAERQYIYYKLNNRMAHIILRLLENNLYHENLYIGNY